MPGPDRLTGQNVAHAIVKLPVSEHTPFAELPDGVERRLRVDLRFMLFQSVEARDETNAIADELAAVILRNFDFRERAPR